MFVRRKPRSEQRSALRTSRSQSSVTDAPSSHSLADVETGARRSKVRRRKSKRPRSLSARLARAEQLEVRAAPVGLLASLPIFSAFADGLRTPTPTDTFDTSVQPRPGRAKLAILPQSRGMEETPVPRAAKRPASLAPPVADPPRFLSVVEAGPPASRLGLNIDTDLAAGFYFASQSDEHHDSDSQFGGGGGFGQPFSSLAGDGPTYFDSGVSSAQSGGSSGGGSAGTSVLDADGNLGGAAPQSWSPPTTELRSANETAESGDAAAAPPVDPKTPIVPSDPAYDDLAAILGEVPENLTYGDVRFTIDDAQAAKGLKIDTAFDPAEGLRAVLRTTGGADQPPTGLQEFQVSLHVGQEVVATYQASVLFPDQRMVAAMHADRAQESQEIIAAASALDAAALLALLDADGTFSDLPSSTPAEPEVEPPAQPPAGAQPEASSDAPSPELVHVKLDRITALAGAVAGDANDSISVADRLSVYAGITKLSADVEAVARAASDTTSGQATTDPAAKDFAHRLGATAYALADRLREDMAGGDPLVALAAQTAYIAAYSGSDLYFRGWTGRDINSAVYRSQRDDDEQVRYSIWYEAGEALLTDQFTVDLGREALVQISVPMELGSSWGGLRVASVEVNEFQIEAEAATYVDEANPTAQHGGDSTMLVSGVTNSRKESFVRFPLAHSDLSTGYVTTATVELYVDNVSGTPDSLAQVVADNSWSETIDWDPHPAGLGDPLPTETPPAYHESVNIDVTDAVRHQLRIGDLDFEHGTGFSHDESKNDLDAFDLYARHPAEYAREFGVFSMFANDALYRADGNFDGEVTLDNLADDGLAILERHGRVQGDANFDDAIDIFDVNNVSLNWAHTNEFYSNGNLNFDQNVDIFDINVISLNWTTEDYDPSDLQVHPKLSLRLYSTSTSGAITYASEDYGDTDKVPKLTITQVPDLVIKDFSSDGENLTVKYVITYNDPLDLQPFDIGIYRSEDAVFDGATTDSLMMTYRVTASGDLTTGAHEITFPIDEDFDTADDLDTSDYHLIANLDDADEYDETAAEDGEENNAIAFSGGVFQDYSGDIHVNGTEGVDGIRITNTEIHVDTLGNKALEINVANAAHVYVRSQGGDDLIVASADLSTPLIVFAGAGDDVVRGGADADQLHGGAGADSLFGGEGNDALHGDDGNDMLNGEGGMDTLTGGAGNDHLAGGAGSGDESNGEEGVDVYNDDDEPDASDTDNNLPPVIDYVGNGFATDEVIDPPDPPRKLEITVYSYNYVAEPVVFETMAYDPEGGIVTYSLEGLPNPGPDSGAIGEFSGAFEWVPDAADEGDTDVYEFTVVATDDADQTAEMLVVVHVVDINIAPTFNPTVIANQGFFLPYNQDPPEPEEREFLITAYDAETPYDLTFDLVDAGGLAATLYQPNTEEPEDPYAILTVTIGPEHAPGTYPIKISVEDGDGAVTEQVLFLVPVYALQDLGTPPEQQYDFTFQPAAASKDRILLVPEDTPVELSIPSFISDLDYVADLFSGVETSVQITTQPSHGVITTNPLTYTPDSGFVGIDVIRFRLIAHFEGLGEPVPASDSVEGNIATVTVVVGNPFLDISGLSVYYPSSSDPQTCSCTCACANQGPTPATDQVTSSSNVAFDAAGVDLNYSSTPLTPAIVVNVEVPPNHDALGDFTADVYADLDLDGTFDEGEKVIDAAQIHNPGFLAGEKGVFYIPLDSPNVPTGQFNFKVKINPPQGYDATSKVATQRLTSIGNNLDGIGPGWSIQGVDHLVFLPYNQETGEPLADVTLVTSDNYRFVFPMEDIQTSEGATAPNDISAARLTEGPFDDPDQEIEESESYFILTDKFGTRSFFDQTGRLTWRVDSNNNRIEYTYEDVNSDGQALELSEVVSQSDNMTTTYEWDDYASGLWHIISVTTSNDSMETEDNRTTTFNYEGATLTSISLPDPGGNPLVDGPTTTFQYGTNTLTVTDADADVMLYTWESAGNTVRVTHFHGAEEAGTTVLVRAQVPDRALVYKSGGKSILWRLPNAKTQIQRGQLSTVLAPRPGRMIDELGRISTYEVFPQQEDPDDPLPGSMKSYTDAMGHTTTYERNAAGQATKITLPPTPEAPSGLVTEYEYDDRLNLIKVTYPNGDEETWTYDEDFGQVIEHVDPDGRMTFYTIDGPEDGNTGNILAMRQVVGQDDEAQGVTETDDVVTSYTYTSEGLIEQITDPLGIKTFFQYNGDHLWLQTIAFDYQGEDPATIEVLSWDSYGNPNAIEDELDRTVVYKYDALDRLLEVRYPDPDGEGDKYDAPYPVPVTKYTYSGTGMLTSVTLTSADDQESPTAYSTEEITTTYHYHGHHLEAIEDPDANETVYEYDVAENLISTTDRAGRETTTQYDLLNRPLVVTLPDPDGEETQAAPQLTYLYDAIGRDSRMADPLLALSGYQYDTRGRLASVTGELGYREEYEYNGLGQLTRFTDALSRQTSYQYDDLARLTEILLPDPDAGTANQPIVFAYDDASRLESVTDQKSRTTDYEYTNRHWLKQVKLPAPVESGTRPETNYFYDDAGNVTSMTELVSGGGSPVYRTTVYAYDALSRLDTITQPLVQDGTGSNATPIWTYKYDQYSRLINVWDPVAASTTDPADSTEYTYNDLHQLTQVMLPEPTDSAARPTTDYTYTLTGLVQTMSELVVGGGSPESRTTTYQYDALDRLVRWISPDPLDGSGSSIDPTVEPDAGIPFIHYQYDVSGSLTSQTDALDQETRYEYDSLYRLTKQTRVDPADEDAETEFEYDLVGNLKTLTDPKENVTLWSYDGLDRVTAETNELMDTRTYEYDLVGNLTRSIDRKGKRIDYAYDRVDRPITEKWYVNTSTSTANKTIAYSYDLLSRLETVTDRNSSNAPASADYTYQYDAGDRVTDVESDLAGLSNNVYFRQQHDLAGRRVRLQVDSAFEVFDFQNDYTRDTLGRLTRLTQDDQDEANIVAEKRVDFTYNLTSQFDTITRYNTLAGDPGDLIAQTTYGYDRAGRLTSLAHDDGGSPNLLPEYGFDYDEANRLIEFTNSAHTDESVSLYQYDAKDQLIDAERAGTALDEDYDYDENGNRESANGDDYDTNPNNQLANDDTFLYQYDEEGNRTWRTRISTDPADDYQIAYAYDQRNRLTKATFFNENSDTTQVVAYTYDPFDRLVKRSLDSDGDLAYDTFEYLVYDGADVALKFDGDGSLTTRYLNGPAVDQILAEETIDEGETVDVLWMLTDHQGSVRDITDNDGAIVDHILYDSYGNPDGDDPNVQNSYGYAGYFIDPVTGFYITLRRGYDPSTGRWLQEDPVPDDTNPYRYARNSTTNLIDPDGLTPISVADLPSQNGGTGAAPATAAPRRSEPIDYSAYGLPTPIGRVENLGDGLHRYTFNDGTVMEEFRDSQLGILLLRIDEPGRKSRVENSRRKECHFNERLRIWEAEGSFTPEEGGGFDQMLDGASWLVGGPVARVLLAPLKRVGAYALGKAASLAGQAGSKIASGARSLVDDAAKLLGRWGQRAFRTGDDARDYLAKMLGATTADTEKVFMTEIGQAATRVRKVDVLCRGVAHESKMGYTAYSEKVLRQIEKDVWLRNNAPGVKDIHWHFFRSAETGRIGADPRVLQALDKAGIKYTIH